MSKNIHEAINTVMQEVGYVKKQKSAGLNYTFAGEAALIAALRPAMVEQGVVMYVSEVSDVVTREYTTKSGSPMVSVTLTAKITFAHAESGTQIVVTSRGEGADSGDKANNKAMTCAYKYALRQTFLIETGDDPDGQQHPRQSEQPRPQAQPHPAPATAQPGNAQQFAGTISPQMIVDAGYADNIPNAAAIINLLKVGGKPAAEFMPRVALYRAHRNSGATEQAAAISAAAGEQPKGQ